MHKHTHVHTRAHMYTCTHATVANVRSGSILFKLVLVFHNADPRDQTQFVRLGSKSLPTGPSHWP